MKSSLLLNATFEPISVIPATRAITLLVNDEAFSLDDSDTIFHSQHMSVAVPYVLTLKNYVNKSVYATTAKFSKRGVLVRDNFTCAYCGNYADTIDHVIPRKDGGLSTYDNCVAACKSCNHKKGHKSLTQMNWTIGEELKAPSPLAKMLSRSLKNESQFNAWSKYIYMFEPNLEKTFSKT